MVHGHGIPIAFGSASGFSAAAFFSAIQSGAAASWLAFLGSVISTTVGLYLSQRRRIADAEIERERQRRQAIRDEMLADALNQLKIQQIRTNPPQSS